MRKLMALVAIVLVATVARPSWALFGLGDVTFDGSLEVRGNSANNETDFGNEVNGVGTGTNDHRGDTATRLRVGMNAQVTDGVMGRVELIRTPARQYGTAATTVAGEEGLLTLHNAYVHFDDLLGFKVRLGRQYVGDPGDLVWNISPKDDDYLTPNSIDGLLVQCRHYEKVAVDFFTGKATENDVLGATDTDGDDVAGSGDVNLNNVQVNINEVLPGGTIGLGYVFGNQANTRLVGDNNAIGIYRIGVKGGLSENMLTYRAEFLQNTGEFKGAGLTGAGAATDLEYSGNAIDLGVGYNTKETSAGSFGVWANWLMASGDDNTQDDKDDSFHDMSPLGFNTSDRLLGEIFGKSNTLAGGSTPLGQGISSSDGTGTAPNGVTQGQGLEVINIGALWKPTFAEKSWLRLDWFTFSQPEDSVLTTVGSPNTNVGSDIGSEIDLTLGYDHSENVNFEVGYAMLSPDEVLTGIPGPGTTVKDEDVTKFFGRAKIKWGGEEK